MLIEKHVEFLEYRGIPVKKITKNGKKPYFVIPKGLLRVARFHDEDGLHELIDKAIANVEEKKRLKEERKKHK